MAFKDERGVNEPSTGHKHIMLTTFTSLGGPFEPAHGPVSPVRVGGTRRSSAATASGSSSSTTI